jgi:hypothetical protein
LSPANERSMTTMPSHRTQNSRSVRNTITVSHSGDAQERSVCPPALPSLS